jgi:hypothetical protein
MTGRLAFSVSMYAAFLLQEAPFFHGIIADAVQAYTLKGVVFEE